MLHRDFVCPTCATPLHLNAKETCEYGVYCIKCSKMLTKEYGSADQALLAWYHGTENLPPDCPFCGWPPNITNPDKYSPQIRCRLGARALCPIADQVFGLNEWNLSRPKLHFLDSWLKRWERKPILKGALRSFRLAMSRQTRNRMTCD